MPFTLQSKPSFRPSPGPSSRRKSRFQIRPSVYWSSTYSIRHGFSPPSLPDDITVFFSEESDMPKNAALFILLWILFLQPVSAEEKPLTIQEAVSTALEPKPEIR